MFAPTLIISFSDGTKCLSIWSILDEFELYVITIVVLLVPSIETPLVYDFDFTGDIFSTAWLKNHLFFVWLGLCF